MEIIGLVIVMAVCYLYAKSVKEQYPEIDVNPELYIVGGFLFGLLSLLYCVCKVYKFKKENHLG